MWTEVEGREQYEVGKRFVWVLCLRVVAGRNAERM